MAFVAYLNSQRIRVSDFTWLEWVRFQQSYREQHLEMACGMRGVPKLSHRNQPYFAHLRRVGCDCPADSLAQMELKRHVWKAVRAAGWQVEFEVRGQIDTRHWFVDVLACKAQEQVGFLIQLDSQAPAYYEERAAACRAASVRPVWLVDRSAAETLWPLSAEPLPIFRLHRDQDGERVDLPRQIPPLPLFVFVRGILAGQLYWRQPGWGWRSPNRRESVQPLRPITPVT